MALTTRLVELVDREREVEVYAAAEKLGTTIAQVRRAARDLDRAGRVTRAESHGDTMLLSTTK